MIGYQPGTGVLHRVHPFTTITLVLAATVTVFALPGTQGPVGLLVAMLALAAVARVPRVFVPTLVVAAPFWFFLLLIHGVFGNDFARAVTLGSRISTMLVAFLILLATVHPERLVEALVARRWPFAAAYLLSTTLQSVPRLRQRAQTILDAQRCRGLAVRGSLARRARAIVPLAVPLVLGALAESEERTFALEARSGGGASRTPLDPPPDSAVQRVLRWVLLGGAGAVVVWGVVA